MDGTTSAILPRLYERDIDVLLQEEIIFNQKVREVFCRHLRLDNNLHVSECELSVFDETGETDLLVRFIDECTRQGVILIENKIDASFQPRQPERYRLRAQTIALEGVAVHTVLVAPERYLDEKSSVRSLFDAFIAHEEIAEAIENERTARASHRAALLLRAVEQARKPYIVIPAPEVTQLWQRVFAIADEEFPLLKMKRPVEKGSHSSWLIFKGNLPRNIGIDWKVWRGTIELSFGNGAPQKPTSSSTLPHGAVLVTSGTTTMIRRSIDTPSEEWTSKTDDEIRSALRAAYEMLEFYYSHSSEFEVPRN